MFEIRVVDLRWRVAKGAVRVNVSRRVHGSAPVWERALGNPFRVVPGLAEGAASAQFRSLLWARLQASQSQEGDALQRICDLAERTDVEIGCWCYGRETCHAHVVARAAQWFATTNSLEV